MTNCHRLKLQALDGKMRETDVLDTKGVLRLIQSIPSPKAIKPHGYQTVIALNG